MVISIAIASVLFLFYMIYRETENSKRNSLESQSKNLHIISEELKNYKEKYYKLKDKNLQLEKKLEELKNIQNGLNKKNTPIRTIPYTRSDEFPPEDLIQF